MASISTCFTITPNSYPKPSIVSLNPSRHFHFPLRARNDNFRTQFSTLRKQQVISNSRTFRFQVRAGYNAPGRVVESDKLAAEVRKRAMIVVDACERRVTVGDVASAAGIRLVEAQKALQAIAADTNGFLEVSDEGDILYVFPQDYRSKLASKSLWIRTEPYLEKAKATAEYLVRVTFGTALIASILIVFTAIVAILTASSDEDDKKSSRKKRSKVSSDVLISLIPSPSDFFWYWDPYYHQRRSQNEDKGMSYFEPVFSFVFGDGDPNEGIEEQRWKMIGQYIGSNDGVVTAEQLAPYLDVETAVNMDDDSYILPVLLRFDGEPQVDNEGNILYRFPSLQSTATSKKWTKKILEKMFTERVGGPDKFFKEKKWEFSKTSQNERFGICFLGGLNLFGVIVLSAMLMTVEIVEPGPFILFVYKILPLLQIYAAAFFGIPLTRWFLIQIRNAEIENRNRARELRAQALASPDIALKRKILSAREMSKRTVIDQHRIVYTTDKDVSEQDYYEQEWDRRFRDIK